MGVPTWGYRLCFAFARFQEKGWGLAIYYMRFPGEWYPPRRWHSLRFKSEVGCQEVGCHDVKTAAFEL